MNAKQMMYYSIIVLAVIIMLKFLVAISWKIIVFSVIGLTLWYLVDKIIKPQIKKTGLLKRFS